MNQKIRSAFGWNDEEEIRWLSPIEEDKYAEYYDESFLERLEVGYLRVPLARFWPRSGPRWDGLARSSAGKLLLVEAKAYVEEGVTFSSKASDASMQQILQALEQTKRAFQARSDAPWATPFYQYANRLAHLHFLRGVNNLDAYLLFFTSQTLQTFLDQLR